MRRRIDKFPPPAHTNVCRVEHTSGRGGYLYLALRTSQLGGEGAAAPWRWSIRSLGRERARTV